MRIRKVLRNPDGKIHLDNGDYYDTYCRVWKISDPAAYLRNDVRRVTNSGDERNGLSKTMTLQEAIKEIDASTLSRFYSVDRIGIKEHRF